MLFMINGKMEQPFIIVTSVARQLAISVVVTATIYPHVNTSHKDINLSLWYAHPVNINIGRIFFWDISSLRAKEVKNEKVIHKKVSLPSRAGREY